MKDFIINFCLDKGFQPINLISAYFTQDIIEYAYMDGEKIITVKEIIKWGF